MLRFIVLTAMMDGVSGGVAPPALQESTANSLVAKLSDPSRRVREEVGGVLKDRADALPWLRRANRSTDADTGRRAADLLALYEKKRQEVVAKIIDVCVRDGRIDLLTEWHQYWKPREEAELWAVAPQASKAGMDLFAKSVPPAEREWFKKCLDQSASFGPDSRSAHNGPCPGRLAGGKDVWFIRTDRMDRLTRGPNGILFASVGGPARLQGTPAPGAHFLVLGSVQTSAINTAFVACDGDVWNEMPEFGDSLGVTTARGIVVCRGNFTGASRVGASVLLVDGDIDLTRTTADLRNCLIRASGEVRLPKGYSPENCTIEAHAKDATAPYKFFELSDVGLSLADDEEGLVVRGAKAGTPFGDCGIRKGDLIRAIDDAPAGTSEEFRRKVRRALVRQGDCLLTVARGEKTLDLPVFFPLPK